MTTNATATVAPPATSFMEEARRYREAGGYRAELVDYLIRCGVDAVGSEQLADRFDLEIGLSGRPLPADASPMVIHQVEGQRQSMVEATPAFPAAFANPATVPPQRAERLDNLHAAVAQSNPPAEAQPAPMASKGNIHKPPRDENETQVEYTETTEFGYSLAASWDDDDPNAAINSATGMARAGKSREEIIEYLCKCGVSEGEAEYVAGMTRAPSRTPSAAGNTTSKRSRRGIRVLPLLFGLCLLAGAGWVGWQGYLYWEAGEWPVRQSPVRLWAAAGGLAVTGLGNIARGLTSRGSKQPTATEAAPAQG